MKPRIHAKSTIGNAKKSLFSAGKAIAAGAAGAAVAAANLGSSIRIKADGVIHPQEAVSNQKKTREVIEMKKSTLVALFVALGAVAGILGALYVYVLRREKELDEYEQLLFSEDFTDDLSDELDDMAPDMSPIDLKD